MYCMKCGAELPEDAVFCLKCGAKIKDDKTQVEQPEKVLMQGLCNLSKSKFKVQAGRAILTNRRFIFLKHSVAETLALGILVNLKEGDIDFDIPVSDIQSLGDGRQGLCKTVVINTKSGKSYSFVLNKREEWKITIQSAIDALKN